MSHLHNEWFENLHPCSGFSLALQKGLFAGRRWHNLKNLNSSGKWMFGWEIGYFQLISLVAA